MKLILEFENFLPSLNHVISTLRKIFSFCFVYIFEEDQHLIQPRHSIFLSGIFLCNILLNYLQLKYRKGLKAFQPQKKFFKTLMVSIIQTTSDFSKLSFLFLKINYSQLFRCFHSLEALQTGDDLTGEAMLSRDDRSDNDLTGGGMDELGLESLGGTFGRGLDERTEIILAATFLVLIILAFIRLVVLVLLLCIYAYLSLCPISGNQVSCIFLAFVTIVHGETFSCLSVRNT